MGGGDRQGTALPAASVPASEPAMRRTVGVCCLRWRLVVAYRIGRAIWQLWLLLTAVAAADGAFRSRAAQLGRQLNEHRGRNFPGGWSTPPARARRQPLPAPRRECECDPGVELVLVRSRRGGIR